jgi:hypothetical protein
MAGVPAEDLGRQARGLGSWAQAIRNQFRNPAMQMARFTRTVVRKTKID